MVMLTSLLPSAIAGAAEKPNQVGRHALVQPMQ
jgi:hypothetical protein